MQTISLHVRVLDSLRCFSDEQLDGVTASSSIFLDRCWFRLLDDLDLAPLLGQGVALRYAVAMDPKGRPVAVCPLLLAHGPSVRFAYSFQKAFFTGWQEELLRIQPGLSNTIRWLSRLIALYRQMARAVGVRTDGWVLAVSPLSFRGGIPVAALPPTEQRRARRAVLDALKEVARTENLPLCLFAVPEEDHPLREAARDSGLEEIFLVPDTYLALEGACMQDYLARFRSRPRAHFKKEMAQVGRAGLRLAFTRDFAGAAAEMTALYEATYTKYGEEHFGHPPEFWRAFARHIGPRAEALMAYRGDELVGFSVLLDKGDLLAYRVGKSTGEEGNSLYFNLVFYEPIRRAYQLGHRRLWVGPGALDTKHHRGAVAHPLYGYFWFPSRRARVLLGPYLRAFGRFTQQQLAFATQPCASLRAPQDGEQGPGRDTEQEQRT